MLTKSREHSRDFFVYVCSLCYSVISWACQRSFTCDRHPSFFRQKKRQRVFEFFINVCNRMFAGVEKC